MKKVVVACQGGGMHAAFEVGVLTEILTDVDAKRFELVGLSGTSAGALCTLMVWYGLAPKKSSGGSVAEAISKLNQLWTDFVAGTGSENILNFLAYWTFKAEETELPLLKISLPAFCLNPTSLLYKAAAFGLPSLGVRKKYIDLNDLLEKTCPEFEDDIIWKDVKTRLLIGASEVMHGFETVFDSDVNKEKQAREVYHWRQRLRLSLPGVAASGTLPLFREAEHIAGGGHYWDGLYSQNPPVREFISGVEKEQIPDEVWIVRINPQQWPYVPTSIGEIRDRQNELIGNLSLNKELDFILSVNRWLSNKEYRDDKFVKDRKTVKVRTIKMEQTTADSMPYSSKFNRGADFLEDLRAEGRQVARAWLNRWPNVGCYPEDAAYHPFPVVRKPKSQATAKTVRARARPRKKK
jgi:NTE family protein